MSESKFKFPIFPDRIYTLEYEGYSAEISGEEILAAFSREVSLDQMFSDIDNDNANHSKLF